MLFTRDFVQWYSMKKDPNKEHQINHLFGSKSFKFCHCFWAILIINSDRNTGCPIGLVHTFISGRKKAIFTFPGNKKQNCYVYHLAYEILNLPCN